MTVFIHILVIVIAVLHLWFLILEMFLWTKPIGIKTFGLESEAFAKSTKVLAANQGLYNGFLSGGLIFGLISEKLEFLVFILICVTLAGIYGSYSTRKPRIFLIQSIPAIIAIVLITVN